LLGQPCVLFALFKRLLECIQLFFHESHFRGKFNRRVLAPDERVNAGICLIEIFHEVGDYKTAEKEKTNSDRDAYENFRVAPYGKMIDRHGVVVTQVKASFQEVYDPVADTSLSIDKVAQKHDKRDSRY
jgi:hypothetical protein